MNLKRYYSHFHLAGLVLLVCIGVLQGCEGESASKRPVERMAAIGEAAPPFQMELFDGGAWKLQDHAGKALVITFMASWCPCSKDSIPIVKEAYSLYNSQGVDFLLVGTQDKSSKFKGFVEEKAVPFPAGFDGDTFIARSYGVKNPPTTVFIDRKGVVKKVFYGNIKDLGKEIYFGWFKEVL